VPRKKPGKPAADASTDDAEFVDRISQAYATDGKTLRLGCAVRGDVVHPDARVSVPLAMMNRHGLIAGATGTGKTVTLQLLAEQLADAGVAVFAADMKGDLSGLMREGEHNDKIDERIAALGIEWQPRARKPVFWSLGGMGEGIPLRATVSGFGPQLLAKVLGSNDTQRSSLALVFAYADSKQLALVDLSDLRSVLQYLTSDDGKGELKSIGGLSSQTAGVLLRDILELEQQGAEKFFGAPEVDIDHLMREGTINLLELPAVQDRPRLFSTFLMWLLAQLFEDLPEVGDLDQPKLVFFFDEAHLLFDDAPKEFLEQVTQTVRLIRSKGVGVFFITQLPDDVPSDVLAQLGNRVQHALRAHTPRDAKALKVAVTTYPKTDDYDLEEDLTRLGIGEAMITLLDEKGAPTPVVWTRLEPPTTKIGDAGRDAVRDAAEDADLWSTYAEEENRESAEEKLKARLEKAADQEDERPRRKSPKDDGGGGLGDVLKTREGRSIINTILRGIFGILRK
jgi:DNA helicase HerA-like ATPase